MTHLNFRLRTIKAIQPISDKAIETDPNKAATWLLELHGREKLKKIIDMVAKARTNAERRASDRTNHSYNTTTVTIEANITQNTPDATVSPRPSPHSRNYTSRFDSWILLCQGTGRRYPTTDDIFHSINYARRPRSFNPEPRAKTNPKCRICKLLESTGTHEGEL